MKWSEIEYDKNHYFKFTENESVVKGFLLVCLGIDLEDIPDMFFKDSRWMSKDNIKYREAEIRKVYLKEVAGSTHGDYSNCHWIQAFQKLKRASFYIQQGHVTPGKYAHELKKNVIEQWAPQVPIAFLEQDDGLYITSNGNHRVIMYMMMYFAALSQADGHDEKEKIHSKYYLWAKVYKQK